MGDGIERLKKIVEPVVLVVLLTSLYFSITDNGETPFKEGFIEMTTDPVFYYIIIGLVGVVPIVLFVDKMMKKNKEGEE
jgi:hypothetical protein